MGRGKNGEFDLRRVPKKKFLEGSQYSNSLERFRRIYSAVLGPVLSRQKEKLVKRQRSATGYKA